MSNTNDALLFKPYKLGDIGTLKHRIVLAPLTRLRNDDDFAPKDIAVKYYTQRASVPGTLLFAEGTVPGPQAHGIAGSPGIWSDKQIAAWKKVTDAVHDKGSFIVTQLWSTGTPADAALLKRLGYDYTNVSAWHFDDVPPEQLPREMTKAEIKEFVALYAKAAKDSVERAGFDGVELHLGNGYLMDAWLQTNSNHRTDEYGGSVENRLRFPLEALKVIVDAVGQRKVGLRISPWARFQGMRMPDADIVETFSTLLTRVRDAYPHLAFVHVVMPRIFGASDDPEADTVHARDSDDYLRAIWKSGSHADERTYIAAGGFSRESAIERAQTGDLVAFGRAFLANPDLPRRLENNWPLRKGSRETYYTGGELGYTDYPSYEEEQKSVETNIA
ncbi:unnamed protein product [Peniophora sp. CBMAI 1063]|nr:unnamed protein product [Peniophora sp. CBMAI 1063]